MNGVYQRRVMFVSIRELAELRAGHINVRMASNNSPIMVNNIKANRRYATPEANGLAGVCNTAPDVGERHMKIWNDAHGPPPDGLQAIRLTSN